MKELLKNNELLRPAKAGEIVEGKIINKGRSSVFLDLGHWGTGIIYGREFQEAKDILKDRKIGDKISAKILSFENEEGYIELSISQAGAEIAWENLKKTKEKGETITVKISGANKGGLTTEISGILAFLPVSQLNPEHYPKVENGEPAKILNELQKFIGKEMTVKILDLDPREEKIILSEKAKETEKIKEVLKNYKAGDIVEGKITGIVEFGAFLKFLPAEKKTEDGKIPEVDELRSSPPTSSLERVKKNFNSFDFANARVLEGLIHISELDWKMIEDPSQVVKVGQVVRAKIIEIQNDRVSLSLRALKEDPWKDIEKKYKKGDKVLGKVTKFNPFGAFVQILPARNASQSEAGGPEIQGLCHISEFGTKSKMENLLKIGEKYDFQILSLDPTKHRITLKLK